jgi:DNA-binding MarR family transcriptional regulator
MDEQVLREQIQIFIRLYGLLEQEYAPCQYPLSPSQAHALQVIGATKSLPHYQLAAHLRLEKSTVSRLVNILVERGWVERTTNPLNRREKLLHLTDAGNTIFEEIQASASAKYHALWQRLPEKRRAQILDALTTLNTGLKEDLQHSPFSSSPIA